MSFGQRQREEHEEYVQLEPSEYGAKSWRKLRVQSQGYYDPTEQTNEAIATGLRLGIIGLATIFVVIAGLFLLNLRGNVLALDGDPSEYLSKGTIAFEMSSPYASAGVNDVDASINSKCLDYQIWGNRTELLRPSAATAGRIKIELNPEEAVTYLVCAAKLRRSRFCNPFYRKRFAIRAKLVLVSLQAKSQIETWQYQRASLPTGYAQEHELPPIPKLIKVREQHFSGHHNRQRFARAVNGLINSGGLSKTDFGWGGLTVPPEFSDAFETASTMRFCK